MRLAQVIILTISFIASLVCSDVRAEQNLMNIPDVFPDASEKVISTGTQQPFNISSIKDFSKSQGWTLGEETLTKSAEFGYILRITFVSKGGNPELENRIIVWNDRQGVQTYQIAIGQQPPKGPH